MFRLNFVIKLLTFALLLAIAPSNVQATERLAVTAGSELDFFPYAFVNQDGEPDGFSVDLIKAVAAAADLDLTIQADKWDRVWNDLVQGNIDILPLVGKLPERATLVEFSTPHTGILDAFFVREGSPGLTTIAAAQGKEIVVMKSDVAHHKLMEVAFEGTIIPVNTITEGLSLVASGKHDAFLGPWLMAGIALKENKIKGLVSEKPVADYLRIQAFAVKKGDFKLLERLNHGLETVKANGEYTKIYNKWLIIEEPTDEILNYGIAGLALVAFIALIGTALVSFKRRLKPNSGDEVHF